MVHSRICLAITIVAMSFSRVVGVAAELPAHGFTVLDRPTPVEAAAPVPEAMGLWDEPVSCDSANGGCSSVGCDASGCDASGCGACTSWCSPCWYGQVDALIWWTKGNKVPPLVTTSPDGTVQANAGVLGQPGTQVLHGGNGVDGNYRVGVRLQVGRWLDACQMTGVEATWFSVGDGANTGNFYAQSVGTPLSPILARPFFNVLAGLQDASSRISESD